ncbi:uncharacterized protein LOC128383568 [Scomber japonicus]|uniref:uncharacterized protein LOC128383568 n=1 Tax=Scomber japonicus TaxID=13676 RepID=UPI0023053D39|nr:uncharacterized protein LOC128383568 [Scomber japonicus]
MKKLWSRLCFLVLAVSSVSRGQNETVSETTEGPDSSTFATPIIPLSLDGTENNATENNATIFMSSSPPENDTALEKTDPVTNQTNSTGQEETGPSTSSPMTTIEPVSETVALTTVASTTATPVKIEDGDSSSWGYVILVFILLVIVILCVILYFLRKVSRSYSFDLQRPSPANHGNEPIGTFEQVYLDDLDQTGPTDLVTNDDDSPPPVTNGTTVQLEDKESTGESALQEQEANGLETLSIGNNTPSTETPLELGSNTVFFDAVGEEQQNENNNNPSICSTDPFVEINLDGPAWSNQLLTSPEVPSSVLPFSPFSFSSSS